jgi:CoA:oxalate CoA-transferase
MVGDAVPLSAIKSIDEVIADPHVQAREMIVDVPVAGQAIAMLGLPIKLSNASVAAHDPAPALGEHNAAVLQGMLDLDDTAFAALVDSGVI